MEIDTETFLSRMEHEVVEALKAGRYYKEGTEDMGYCDGFVSGLIRAMDILTGSPHGN
jgi:hypothetical protein